MSLLNKASGSPRLNGAWNEWNEWNEWKNFIRGRKGTRFVDAFMAGWAARKNLDLANGYSAGTADNNNLPGFDFTQDRVRRVLAYPWNYVWTIQGLGMLRAYVCGKKYRINVWHSQFHVPNVSTVHDHPWDFRSWIVAGHFTNQRYDLKTVEYFAGPGRIPYRVSAAPSNFHCQTIKCGEGSGPVGEVQDVFLWPRQPESYRAGDTYRQNAKEIHASHYDDGTVTLNERRPLQDSEHARVFWPYGTQWVGAAPRKATDAEIYFATRAALDGINMESMS